MLPAATLSGRSAYSTPPQRFPVDLRLDANEGPSPSTDILAALARLTPEDLRRYHRPVHLEARLAELHGVDPSRVVVTNGGDDAIDRVCRAVLEPRRTAVLHTPTFEIIPAAAGLAGAELVEHAWLDAEFPTSRFIASIDDRAGLAAVVSPNNPTGSTIPRDALSEIVAATGGRGCCLMVDLAYVEFADDDPTHWLIGHDHVVVIRTFSKAFGLAGARVGYAVASAEVAGWLRTVGGPFPVSAMSIAAAEAALAGPLPATVSTVRDERGALARTLHDAGVRVAPSQGNFIFATLPNARLFRDALAAQGVGVRGFHESSPLAGSVRITLPGDRDTFRRLARAVERALAVHTETELEALLP
ncbi:MAG: histidinol-phosphate transaminase [Planctomycetota bacterium]